MKINIKKKQSQKIYSGQVLDFYKDDITINNSIEAIREYVTYPEAAGIIPIINDKIIMVEQYRYAADCISLEIPAGKKYPDEDIIQCANRELEEETGYKSEKIIKLCDYFPSISYSTEKLHIFIAENLSTGRPDPDHDEFCQIRILSLKEIIELITQNKIKDSKTILAIMLYQHSLNQNK